MRYFHFTENTKGGRISKTAASVGSALGILPILIVEKGSIIFKKMIRGKKRTLQELAERIIQKAANFPSQLIVIAHADDLPSVKALEELIKKGLPYCATTLCEIGGVLGVHLGLKGIGAFCFNQKSEHYCLV